MSRSRMRSGVLIVALAMALAACDSAVPLQPVNRSPIAIRLVAFPALIGPGDSAIVVCTATEPDGDTLLFDWTSDCRMLKSAPYQDNFTAYSTRTGSMVVHAGACNRAPLDTGWVRCFVRDGRGGGADGGLVRIVVRQ